LVEAVQVLPASSRIVEGKTVVEQRQERLVVAVRVLPASSRIEEGEPLVEQE